MKNLIYLTGMVLCALLFATNVQAQSSSSPSMERNAFMVESVNSMQYTVTVAESDQAFEKAMEHPEKYVSVNPASVFSQFELDKETGVVTVTVKEGMNLGADQIRMFVETIHRASRAPME